MATLTITRGLPGSGKTTWARAAAGRGPGQPRRPAPHAARRPLGAGLGRGAGHRAPSAPQVDALLRGGRQCDLRRHQPARHGSCASSPSWPSARGATFAVRDFTDVPLEECIAPRRRCGTARPGRRGRDPRHAPALPRRPALPLPLPVLKPRAGVAYEPPPDAPAAVLVDIDGTVALIDGRSPYDMTRVARRHAATTPVIAAVRAMHAAGHGIVFCSGRTDDGRDATAAWLDEHVGVPYDGAAHARHRRPAQGHGRQAGDLRPGDPRPLPHRRRSSTTAQQVVRMWRALGLTVFQVADGNF